METMDKKLTGIGTDRVAELEIIEPGKKGASWSVPDGIYRLGSGKHPSMMHMKTPAIEVIRSARSQSHLTVDWSLRLDDAIDILENLDTRYLVVTGQDQRVLGVLHMSDAMGEKPMMLVNGRGLLHSDIVVGDVMAPLTEMHVINCTNALKMSVSDVVDELDRTGKTWAIAVSRQDESEQWIEGIFFAPDIVRRLDPTATWAPARRSFADIEAAISH
ncbi:hypothetical protein ACO0LO_10310 [Undibacterium sp. TJN25]|uniref:hypothetical protein n=1 Tax=Undibacterium sp. TJN25 TaxID=3413056 RepID=UPI003BF16E42